MIARPTRKVVLIELNEITWRFVDPFLQNGTMPALADLVRRGARGTPIAPEVPPDLDPWISWMTVYTGRPPEEHGVKFLEQPPETVRGPKIWDLVADAGKSLGLFGSIMSWPPRKDVKGFWVPGTFSPSAETFPAELQPIQDMNLKYTRAHTPLADGVKTSKLGMLAQLRKLGLKVTTLASVARYFARRTLRLAKDWEKVSYQPLINLDFFEALWKKHRPDFSTFHSNHVAHYQHRFWRSTDPTPFLEKPDATELKQFGGSIQYGYRTADQLIRRVQKFVNQDTVLVVASGLGQQPYVVEEYRGGRSVVRIQDIGRVLELLGVAGKCNPYSVMAPQWNIQFDDPEVQRRTVQGFQAAYYKTPDQPLFSCQEVGNTICVNALQKLPRPIDWDADCVFPTTERTTKMRDLCAEKDATPKQGYHDQAGMIVMSGPGVRTGATIGACSTLDIAPTLLTLLGLPIPVHMKGRVLEEALEPDVRPIRADQPAGDRVLSPAGA
ncbi:Type I phosphodiesterase / nucleotide pyrophosphatase [Gemmata sp. SH-PL17]|uniref:alkaline phosphatase family protein n=1 Tax=Gemmata sp. SH-PL17 TaxID=1630693 RepID=UPI00078EA00C|nr:alkaline phosphatase family protein [Gemmata sp. SH-PL17]AMV27734.1 Type I phosphodiesterase / nucleotide pyrophosphatase [Gemmata sp. SH-PL17]